MAYIYKSGIRLVTQTGLRTFGSCLPENYVFQQPYSIDYATIPQYVEAAALDGLEYLSGAVTRSILTLTNGYTLKFVWDGANSTNTGFYWFDQYDQKINKAPGFPAAPSALTYWKYYIGICELNGVRSINCFGVYKTSGMSTNDYWLASGQSDGDSGQSFAFIEVSIAPDDPYGTIENLTETGGYGNGDYSGDPIDFPTLPTISASDAGFVTLYNPTVGEMQTLASELWTGVFDINNFRKIFADPMDCILSVGIVPVTPTTSAAQAMKIGNYTATATAKKITSQFVTFSCGSLTVNGQTASNMDYSPYTKAELFLPYCGTHAINIDDIMDSTLTITYYIDLYTGACVVHVKVSRTNSDGSTLDSVLYQFTGNCLCNIPITATNHSNFMQALIGAAATAIAVGASGGAAAPAAGAAATAGTAASGALASSAINTVMSAKPIIAKSGNLSSNAGFLGTQKPFLIITAPSLCRPSSENEMVGTPYYKSGTLSDFSGYTEVAAVHLDNLSCTEAERNMIEASLKTGVIL